MLNLEQFHHITNEVASVEKTRDFYVRLFGFEEVRRPNLNVKGAWLDGLGLHLHLIQAANHSEFEKRRLLRVEEFTQQVPFVDHFAFLAHDLDTIEDTLRLQQVPYKRSRTTFGASQIFLLDPDARIIELADCAPKRNEIACVPGEPSTNGERTTT